MTVVGRRFLVPLFVGLAAWPCLAADPAGGKAERVIEIACPPTFPGTEVPAAPVWDTLVYRNYHEVLIPGKDDPVFDEGDIGSIQMDCVYVGGRHLTIEVPGRPVTCHSVRPADGRLTGWPGVCMTRPGLDGRLANPKPILAEGLGPETLIQGFGLRWPLARVRDAARDGGYGVEAPAAPDGQGVRLVASKGDDRVEIRFSRETGLSREVVWAGPTGPREVKMAFVKIIGLRFGVACEVTEVRRDGWTCRRGNGGTGVVLDVSERYGPTASEWQNFAHLIDLGAQDKR